MRGDTPSYNKFRAYSFRIYSANIITLFLLHDNTRTYYSLYKVHYTHTFARTV